MRTLNFFLSTSILLLLWSDLFNYLLSSGPLVVWKQILILVYWALAFLVRGSDEYRPYLFAGVFYLCLAIAYSMFIGVSAEVSFYNSFLYLSWLPTFVLARCGLLNDARRRFARLWMPLLLLSCLGLVTDLFTDIFRFASPHLQLITGDYFDENNVAKRARFFFVSSTMVVPLLSIFAVFAIDVRDSEGRRWLCAIAVVLGGACTGSLSSVAVALVLALAFMVSVKVRPLSICLITLCLLAIPSLMSLRESNELIGRQVDRLVDNVFADSEANAGRIDLWAGALEEIGAFTPVEHVLGTGLGATNDNLGNEVRHLNGESSLLQAYLELGWGGVMTRLIPLAYLLLASLRTRGLVAFAWGASSLVAIALAPTFGNVPFQVALGLMMGRTASISRNSGCSESRWPFASVGEVA